jgi:protein TonB
MKLVHSRNEDRIKGTIGAAILQGLFLYALINGLAVKIPAPIGDDLKLFGIAPEPPPAPLEKVVRHRRSRIPEGAASPPNLRAKPTEIVAPPPVLPLVVPPPVVTALIAGPGSDPSAGASDVRGPGTGSGGVGTGTGSGGNGNGEGAGDGDETPPRWLRGRIKDSDYPRAAGEAGNSGTVSVRYAVGRDGRVSGCAVTRSSGSKELDETTCRLIEQRFRYAPSRDAHGRAVPSIVVEDHDWVIERVEPPPEARR